MSFEFLSGINMLSSSVLGIVIPFLFVLTPVVFFHELGHFLVARWCGVKILIFSIGFGPEALSQPAATAQAECTAWCTGM